MNPELTDLIATSMIQYSPMQIVTNLVFTLVIAILIYFVYKMSYTGVLYSRDFNITIMLITLVTAMVIMIIGGNLTLSLGMVGALSIIRFRSAIKDPKDIGFLFWGIAAGLATGTGAYSIALIASIMIAIIMLVVNRKRFTDDAYLLIVKGGSVDKEGVESLVKKMTKRYRLRMSNHMSGQQEIIYEVKIKKEQNVLIRELEALEAVEVVNLVTYNGEISN